MRHPVCATIAAACALACGAAAEAQSLSRADLEFGTWGMTSHSGLEMGVTAWVSDHSGFAARGLLSTYWAGFYRVDFRGFEAQYRHRRFLKAVEIDFGAGLVFWTGDNSIFFRDAVSRMVILDTVDILVGRRFLERFSVRVGLSTRAQRLFPGHDILGGLSIAGKLQVSVPLGKRR